MDVDFDLRERTTKASSYQTSRKAGSGDGLETRRLQTGREPGMATLPVSRRSGLLER